MLQRRRCCDGILCGGWCLAHWSQATVGWQLEVCNQPDVQFPDACGATFKTPLCSHNSPYRLIVHSHSCARAFHVESLLKGRCRLVQLPALQLLRQHGRRAAGARPVDLVELRRFAEARKATRPHPNLPLVRWLRCLRTVGVLRRLGMQFAAVGCRKLYMPSKAELVVNMLRIDRLGTA